jgi:hypothetical protein
MKILMRYIEETHPFNNHLHYILALARALREGDSTESEEMCTLLTSVHKVLATTIPPSHEHHKTDDRCFESQGQLLWVPDETFAVWKGTSIYPADQVAGCMMVILISEKTTPRFALHLMFIITHLISFFEERTRKRRYA